MLQNQEYIQEFVDEAKGHLETIESILLRMDEIQKSPEPINEVFRAVHSIKGTAGFFGLQNIVGLSHAMENVFGEMRDGHFHLTDESADVLLTSNDCLRNLIEHVAESETMPTDSCLRSLEGLLGGSGRPDSEQQPCAGEQRADPAGAGNPEARNAPEKLSGPAGASSVGTMTPAAKGKTEPARSGQQAAPVRMEDSVRVNVQILNDLLNMASEMVLGRNQLLRTLENYKKTIPGLAPILQNVDRLTSGMQEKVMQTRMQPVANVFSKFPRMIRDLSRTLHKEIELTIEGSDVELDKSMIEALGDPMAHLVRNAADHGLESPEEREAAGKSRIGNILLKAYHEGGFVNIDVSDDGGGLDVEKIKRKAIENSLATRPEIEAMSEQDVFKLIFRPGFSTAEEVTDLSGRGVGMDVVRTNVEKLGGSIEIYSSAGKGTTFRLVLPLTLAIIQSLIVETAGQTFAFPQVNMKEIVRIKTDSNKIERINGTDVLRLRGKLLPVISLSKALKTGENTAAESEETIIVVIKVGAARFGIAVRSILESEETLVKPLPQALKCCACYSGVTILGDGKTAMILDPEGIIKAVKMKNIAKFTEEESAAAGASAESGMAQQDLLLFQCSGNETFALDMSLVARVEAISQQQIDKVGSREFFQYRGDTLRIIRPEDFLPVNRGEMPADKMYVIIPKLVSHPMGILARRIVDNVKTVVRLNSGDLKSKGLLGSMLHNGKIVLLLQLYELFELADPSHYSSQGKRAGGSYHLLLVEDTPFFQKVIREYFEEAGYGVTVAPNGKAALECLECGRFDAVVSDINMPVMNGLELVRRIRDDASLAEMPVVALTSLTGEKNEEAGLNSGFDCYECKLDREHLLSTMQSILNRKKGGDIAC